MGGAREVDLLDIDNDLLPKEIDSSLFQTMTGFAVKDEKNRLSGLEPDMLGELFLLRRIEGGIRIGLNQLATKRATKKVMQLAYCLNAMATTDCCGRAINDFSASIPDATKAIQNTLSSLDLSDCHGLPSLIRNDPVSALFARTAVALRTKEYGPMIADFTTIMKMEEASEERKAQAILTRAVIYERMGAPEKAIADLSDYFRLEVMLPDMSASAFSCRGKSHLQMNNYDLAVADFTTVLESQNVLDEQMSQAFDFRGCCYAEMGNHQLAINDYSAAIDTLDLLDFGAKSNRLYINRGISYAKLEEYESAIKDFDLAMNLIFDETDELLANALTCRAGTHGLMGNRELAIADYSNILSMANVTTEQKVKSLYELSLIHI